MRVCTFASGSSGNCALVSFGDTHLLLDAGISYRRICVALSALGLAPSRLSGVLITHEHSDHISGLRTMAKRCAVPVYAPRTIANRLRGAVPEAAGLLREFPVGQAREIDGVTVLAFHTPHDTDESVGWRLSAGGLDFALATDMGCVTPEVRDGLLGADAVVIEANHDIERLRSGPYPVSLKRRILSDHGHLSNDDCALLAALLAQNGARTIILGHLSRENNLPELAFQTVAAALQGTETALYVAPADRSLTVELEAEACAV